MRDQIISTVVFWFLWLIGISGMLMVIHDIFTGSSLTLSQQLFAIFIFFSIPLSYGYWSERQDVCS
jgi:hypothetical protein